LAVRAVSTKAWLAVLVALPAMGGCLNAAAPAPVAATAYEGQLREFDLYVSEAATLQPSPGKSVVGLGFALSPDGPFTVPGPEIRIREGDTLRVTLHSVGIGHTVHWHGIKLPWSMDGVPFMTQGLVTGNSTYVYEWTARESGTYWYHCHVDAPTHIDGGLFGALIIEPRDPTQDPAFDREYTLMLHELDSTMFMAVNAAFGGKDLGNMPRNPFDAADALANSARATVDVVPLIAEAITGAPVGTLGGAAGPRDYYPAASIRYRPQYDTFMINGHSFPETDPLKIRAGETIRVRLVNAGQLVHTMHLHGTHFLVTHKDGYKLPAAYYADSLLIGPGERYDIYVKGDNPGIWDFHDHSGGHDIGAYAANDHAFPGGMSTMLVYEDFAYAQLPEPEPGQRWTSGDYVAWAPSYKGDFAPAFGHPEHQH
jgi:FtsP/CotA-like multicopper oxidase with cupredoxin domain